MNRMIWMVALLTAGLALPAQAASVRYVHTDALGSIVAETDENRVVLERREYEPYGRQLAPANVQDGPGYTGHVQDAVTQLTYMQQRYYDPGIGMFLSVDPVTAYSSPIGQFHRYRYGNNNPYKFTDPDGREGECINGPTCAFVQAVRNAVAVIDGVEDGWNATDVRLEGGVSVFDASISLKNGDFSGGITPVAHGAVIGIFVQPMEGVEVPFVDSPIDAPVDMDYSFLAGDIVGGGVDVRFNPGGTVEATPKFGVALGARSSYTPSVNFNGGNKEEDKKKEEDKPDGAIPVVRVDSFRVRK